MLVGLAPLSLPVGLASVVSLLRLLCRAVLALLVVLGLIKSWGFWLVHLLGARRGRSLFSLFLL